MKKRFVTFKPFDVVTMAFPYADRMRSTIRPAIVLSSYANFGEQSGIALSAMITSATHSSWPLDVPILDLDLAGLNKPCVVRLKLNSVAYALMNKKIGEVSERDRVHIREALRKLLVEVN